MLEKYIELLKNNKKKIILPEGDNEEILESVNTLLDKDIIDIILLGNKELNTVKYPNLIKVTFINPEKSSFLDNYADRLYELRKEKGITREYAKKLLLNDYMYFACMMLLDKKADGIVSGIEHLSSDTIRPALQLIKGKEKLVSSFFIIESNNKLLGSNGIFLFADCALNINPNSEELSIIAKQSINSFRKIVGDTPKLAFLSHSTKGSSNHIIVDKIKNAVELSKKLIPNEIIDGEMQLDAAIIPDIANVKNPNGTIKGDANILIFPDIDSGNIGYKLVERFGNCKAFGPITQGMNYPVNDLSRGSSVDDIIGVIVITALQAMENMI